ncbi:MAG: polysaccharide deacetylase family protein [Velocimicrobium sp.]
MGNEMKHATNINLERIARKKSVKRMKKIIIIALVISILIPIVCCIGLMIRINQIEKQLNELVMEKSQKDGEYLNQLEDETSGSIAYAAEADKSQVDENKNQQESKDFDEESGTGGESEELVLTPDEKVDLETKQSKVYLTFDDGPGKYTDELLDVLKQYNVKATFFVIGKTDEHSLDMYHRIVDEGHTLAMHSYSHQYSKIYKSVKAFKKDLNQLSDLLYETTGIRPTAYRFPGGSSNTVSDIPMTKFIKYLNLAGITYYDWNVVNGDATGKDLTEKQMISNVMNGVKKHNNSIVLMHDTASKDTTLKSIPELIKELRKTGYIIVPITKYTNTVQHIKADLVE